MTCGIFFVFSIHHTKLSLLLNYSWLDLRVFIFRIKGKCRPITLKHLLVIRRIPSHRVVIDMLFPDIDRSYWTLKSSQFCFEPEITDTNGFASCLNISVYLKIYFVT